MFLEKIRKFLKKLNFTAKLLKFIKAPVPYLTTIQLGLGAILLFIEQLKNQIIKQNQRKSDEIIKQAEESATKVEEERAKPLPEQNNDVLREEARRRHRGQS